MGDANRLGERRNLDVSLFHSAFGGLSGVILSVSRLCYPEQPYLLVQISQTNPHLWLESHVSLLFKFYFSSPRSGRTSY